MTDSNYVLFLVSSLGKLEYVPYHPTSEMMNVAVSFHPPHPSLEEVKVVMDNGRWARCVLTPDRVRHVML